jgi:hypothetical protein
MTADERALLAAINQWRRATDPRGRSAVATWNGYVTPDRRFAVETDLPTRPPSIGVRRRAAGGNEFGGLEVYPAQSVTQAVDLLAALGALPVRFSSGYRLCCAEQPKMRPALDGTDRLYLHTCGIAEQMPDEPGVDGCLGCGEHGVWQPMWVLDTEASPR